MFDDVEREDERDEKMKLKVIPIALCIGTENRQEISRKS